MSPAKPANRSRQRDFHRLDDVALQHLHHFQLEAADAILHGANPGEIHFYQVSKFEFSINLKTAKAARAYGTVHLACQLRATLRPEATREQTCPDVNSVPERA